jgi:hypothetical protein
MLISIVNSEKNTTGIYQSRQTTALQNTILSQGEEIEKLKAKCAHRPIHSQMDELVKDFVSLQCDILAGNALSDLRGRIERGQAISIEELNLIQEKLQIFIDRCGLKFPMYKDILQVQLLIFVIILNFNITLLAHIHRSIPIKIWITSGHAKSISLH